MGSSVETQQAWVRLVKMKLLIFLFVAVLGVTLAVAQEKGFSNLLFDPFELVNRIDSQGSSFQKSFVAKKKLFDLESFTFKPLTVTTTRKPRRKVKASRPRPRPTTQKPTTIIAEITTLKPLTTREPEAPTVVEIKSTEVPTVVEVKTTEVPESNNEIDVETMKPKKSQLNTSDRDWIKSIRRRTTRRTTTSTTTTTTTTTTATTTIRTTPAPTTLPQRFVQPKQFVPKQQQRQQFAPRSQQKFVPQKQRFSPRSQQQFAPQNQQQQQFAPRQQQKQLASQSQQQFAPQPQQQFAPRQQQQQPQLSQDQLFQFQRFLAQQKQPRGQQFPNFPARQ